MTKKPAPAKKLTHLDDRGAARMVDVSDKPVTSRSATARGRISMKPSTLKLILDDKLKKGNALEVARLAGIMAAKKAADLIPLCHPLAISKVEIELHPDKKTNSVEVEATVKLSGQTGVEMEALTAVSVACLTLYDMAKAVDRGMVIGDIRLTGKSGGKSGDYRAHQEILMAQQTLLPVADARARILATLHPTQMESVLLADAYGRVLAEDAIARRTQPPADLSAMDGYAVKAADTASIPARLRIVGEAPAGGAYADELKSGEAVRIFTGAPLPRGADAIVIQEDTERDGGIVIVKEAAKAGRHVRSAGLDFRTGDCGIPAGQRLSPADVALAAAMNLARLNVRKRPVIAFFSTGDELVPPGTDPGPNRIVSANNDGLAAVILEACGLPLDLGIAADSESAIRAAAEGARDADMLVTLGGASVGDHDLVQSALVPLGLDIDFWKIAMRPGKPLMYGRLGEMPFLGLPGNPVSALVCAMLFLQPAIARLQGGDTVLRTTLARLGAALPANDRREDYVRAGLDHIPGNLPVATPAKVQDSSMLSVLARAGCLIIRPPEAPEAKAGEIVTILPLRA